MFVLNLVFLALLASSVAQAGISRYIQGQWIVEDPQYDDFDGRPLPVEEERMWPENPPEVVELVTVEDDTVLTTPCFAMKAQDSDEGEESAVWRIVLVVAVLLVSVVGSLSVAYYMCVWRGGRIHYQTQKEDYS